MYRYDNDSAYYGNLKLSLWDNGNSMIETRGEGGYVIVSPTEGYVPMQGDLLNLTQITYDERDYLIEKCKKLNHNSRVDIQYISHVLRNEFNLTPSGKSERYFPFGITALNQKVGKTYAFIASDFDVIDLVTDVTDDVTDGYTVPF